MAKSPSKRKCVQCGNSFEAKRTDARFCSPNCRQKFTRSQPTSKDLFPDVMGNPDFHKAVMEEAVKKGVKILTPKRTYDNRNVINPEADRTKQMKEPEEGTNAFFMRYGALYKKDIPK